MNSINSFTWTDGHCDELRRLVGEGLSYALIAEVLGCGTRNAAIGKAKRLGLCNASPRITKPRRPARARGYDGAIASRLSHSVRREPIAEVKEPAAMPQIDDHAIPIEQRVTSVLGLTDATCRWPVGEGTEMWFCGAVPVEGYSYCGPHCRRAFAGAPDGARRRPFLPMRRHAA